MESRPRRRWKVVAVFAALAALYWPAMFLATHLSIRTTPAGDPYSLDKFEHLAAFANLADVGRHERQGCLLLLFDFILRYGEFLALRVGQHELRVFLPADEAANDAAVGKTQRGGPEGHIDVAIGIEDVFEEAIETAIA